MPIESVQFARGEVLTAQQLNRLSHNISTLEKELEEAKTGGDGLTSDEKALLLTMFSHTAYTDDRMKSVYDKLHDLWEVEPIEPETPFFPVESVTLDKASIKLKVGGASSLSATVLPKKATDKTVTWDVSPSGCITFDEDGKITAIAKGECTITATAGEQTASCTVTVKALPVSTSVPGETPVYRLAASKTFVPEKKEYIDTGIKMLASIDPKPSWTILFEVQCGENVAAKNDTYMLLHCMSEIKPWPGFCVQIASGGELAASIYNTRATVQSLYNLKASKCRLAIRMEGDKVRRWMDTGDYNDFTVSGYNVAVDKSLLLGCYQEEDGTKGRFWDGTLYQCLIYNKALTDEQIETWITT